MPVTSASTPATRADRARDDVVAQRRRARRPSASSVPLPGIGIDDDRDASCRGLTSCDRLGHLAGRERASSRSSRCPAWTSGARDVVGLDDDDRRQRAAGERGLDAVVGLHDRQAARQARDARVDRVHAERRDREQRRARRAAATTETTGRASTRSRIAPHTRDSPWLRWRRPADDRARGPSRRLSPSLDSTAGSTVTRADHRDRDDEDRADGERR